MQLGFQILSQRPSLVLHGLEPAHLSGPAGTRIVAWSPLPPTPSVVPTLAGGRGLPGKASVTRPSHPLCPRRPQTAVLLAPCFPTLHVGPGLPHTRLSQFPGPALPSEDGLSAVGGRCSGDSGPRMAAPEGSALAGPPHIECWFRARAAKAVLLTRSLITGVSNSQPRPVSPARTRRSAPDGLGVGPRPRYFSFSSGLRFA